VCVCARVCLLVCGCVHFEDDKLSFAICPTITMQYHNSGNFSATHHNIIRSYNTVGSGKIWIYLALVPNLQVFTVDCVTPLTWFSCCLPLSSSSGVLFILVPCCTEVAG
jgi:hypothetical protein